jgi:type IV pilus assembly protein PilA
MKKKLNQKGFTLVELLAVLVILIAIMGIAIPTISSSLERTKAKQNEARYRIIESAAEQYVTDHKNAIYKNLNENDTNSCAILISKINYLTDDEMKDADDTDLSGHYIIFTRAHQDNANNQIATSYDYNATKTVSLDCM